MFSDVCGSDWQCSVIQCKAERPLWGYIVESSFYALGITSGPLGS